MRMRRIVSTLLLAAYLPACTAYQATQQPLSELTAPPKPVGLVLVKTANGDAIEVRDPRVAGDTLVGHGTSTVTKLPVEKVPMDQVRGVEVKRFSAGKTIALVVMTAGVAALVGVMSVNSSLGDGSYLSY